MAHEHVLPLRIRQFPRTCVRVGAARYLSPRAAHAAECIERIARSAVLRFECDDVDVARAVAEHAPAECEMVDFYGAVLEFALWVDGGGCVAEWECDECDSACYGDCVGARLFFS